MRFNYIILIILLQLCGITASVRGQFVTIQNASATVQTTPTLLQLDYLDVDEFLHPKELLNAIHLTIMLRQQSSTTTARLQYTSGPVAPSDWVSIRLASKTSDNAVIPNVETVLVPNAEVPVIMQPAHTPPDNLYHYYTFNYDLILNPRTTFVQPGTYNFTITYTMTPQ